MADNYQGPGNYKHYKGGSYYALGIGEVEYNGNKMVVYISRSGSEAHTAEREKRGVAFVLRPLNTEDGPDAWNEMIGVEGAEVDLVPRFVKTVEFIGGTADG